MENYSHKQNSPSLAVDLWFEKSTRRLLNLTNVDIKGVQIDINIDDGKGFYYKNGVTIPANGFVPIIFDCLRTFTLRAEWKDKKGRTHYFESLTSPGILGGEPREEELVKDY